MGLRSTLVSQDCDGKLPDWFKDKYNQWISFPRGLLISSKAERKFYDNEFFEDYQKAVIESGFWNKNDIGIVIVVLGEDDFISKVIIKENEIRYIWMKNEWEADHVWRQG